MLDVFEQEENVGVVGNVQRLAGTKLYDHMGVVFGPKETRGITDNGLRKSFY